MVSFLRRVLTSCSITRACSGPTSMGVTPLKGGGRAPHSLVLQCAWPIETHLAVVSMLPNSLLREPVSQDWPLVYLELLARCPDVEDWQGTAALAALETLKRGRRASQLTEHIRDWHAQRALLNDKKLTPAARHMLLSILVMTSPAPDVWPSILTDYTYDSELDNADGIPQSVYDAARVPGGELCI